MTIWYYLQTTPWALYLVTILTGLCAGSFFNVAIHRMPLMLHRLWHREATDYLQEYPAPPDLPKPFNLFVPRSHCPNCQRNINSWQNIPIISFILLRGRCRCGKAISWRYPITELLTALVAVVVVVHYGWSWQVWPALIFSGYLIVMALIDFDQQFLLDDLTLGLLWLGLIANHFGFYTSLENALFGAVFGYLSLWIIAKLFYLISKREGMAYGDFKLLAALGAWLGWQSLPLVLLVSCLAGIVMSVILHCFKRIHLRHPIPFGPYLALAGWLYLLVTSHWPLLLSVGGL